MSETKFEIDCMPEPEMVLALMNSPGSLTAACGELIDNAFDAGASTIDLHFDKGTFRAVDNGAGIANIALALRMGGHVAHKRTSLGIYGVGLKDAALWFGGPTEIVTCRSGKIIWADIDWAGIARRRSWKHQAAEYPEAEGRLRFDLPRPSGTSITCHHGRKRRFDENQRDRLLEELSYRFGPAIEDGKQIAVHYRSKRLTVPAFKMPALTNIIEADREVMGLRYRVRAGVVPDGAPNPRCGFNLAFGHRVIANTSNGCNGYSTAQFFGWVHLADEGWRPKLLRNKDGIIEGNDALFDDLLLVCRDTLSSASQQSRTLHLSSLAAKLTTDMSELFKREREKRRKRSNATGGVKPKGTGVMRQNAAQTSDKQGNVTRSISGISIDFYRHGSDDTIGEAECLGAETYKVKLNLDHPMVEFATAKEWEPLLTHAVASLLASHMAFQATVEQKQRLLGYEADERAESVFINSLAKLTKGISKPALKVAEAV